jgi:hypothetical protein
VRREHFQVPAGWLERSARAEIRGDGVQFSPRVAAMPYSIGTGSTGASGPVRDGGRGTEADFTRLGTTARAAFVLIEQDELQDVDGLFREYDETAAIEQRARAAGVAGLLYMSSRASGILYRHNVAIGPANTKPMVILERDAARRVQQLLRAGSTLTVTLNLDVDASTNVGADNVVAEIPARPTPARSCCGARTSTRGISGRHARQRRQQRAHHRPGAADYAARPEAGAHASTRALERRGARYARLVRVRSGAPGRAGPSRRGRVDRHRLRTNHGFFTGGRPDVVALTDRSLTPFSGLGPFAQVDVPLVGTDNFDFMLEGVPNLVANQEPARTGRATTRPTISSASAIPACCVSTRPCSRAFSGTSRTTRRACRATRGDIQALMDRTDLDDQMKTFNLWDEWAAGTRGRK